MLVFGLVAGPFLGLFAGQALKRFSGSEHVWGAGLLVVVCLIIMFALHMSTEAKLGIITGILLGLLLSASSLDAVLTDSSVPEQRT